MNASGEIAERQIQNISEKIEILDSFFDLRAKIIYNCPNGNEDIREELLALREKLSCTMNTYRNDCFVKIYIGRIDDLLRYGHHVESECSRKHRITNQSRI